MQQDSNSPPPAFSASKFWPVGAGLLVAILGLAYGLRGGTKDRDLITNQHALSVSVHQLQKQVEDISDRLGAINALQEKRAMVIEPQQQPEPQKQPEGRKKQKPEPVRQPLAAAKPAEDLRWKTLQKQLTEQSRQLTYTQEELERARQSLESKLGATRDDLSGSIARTNEDLGELRKRGERDYHEFQLSKSKTFQRTGPLSLALRKADTKRKRFDIDLLIDDVKLEKRNVNLYEPIVLRSGPQPLELVVNEVTKDRVKGYVSVAKTAAGRQAAR